MMHQKYSFLAICLSEVEGDSHRDRKAKHIFFLCVFFLGEFGVHKHVCGYSKSLLPQWLVELLSQEGRREEQDHGYPRCSIITSSQRHHAI